MQDTTSVSTAKRLRGALEDPLGPIALHERRAGGADNCEYERAVRLMPVLVVRRSVMGVGWGESALLTQSSDPPASECDIFVYLRGEARSSLLGGEVHVSLSTVRG